MTVVYVSNIDFEMIVVHVSTRCPHVKHGFDGW